MHTNSLSAYHQERPRLSQRAAEVLGAVVAHGPMSDREIMDALGFRDPNTVRPRVTELIRCGLLVEHSAVRCPVTGKTVRRVAVRKPGEQGRLF